MQPAVCKPLDSWVPCDTIPSALALLVTAPVQLFRGRGPDEQSGSRNLPTETQSRSALSMGTEPEVALLSRAPTAQPLRNCVAVQLHVPSAGAGEPLYGGQPNASVSLAAVSTRRKRGKCMSRRRGQLPTLKDRNGVYSFRFWQDVPGREERQQVRRTIGSAKQMTKSEAHRKMLEIITGSQVNSSDYRIPSPKTFADAVRFYRQSFAPRMLRDKTYMNADGHLKNHLESDWNDVPLEHITMESVNAWAAKKRRQGLSWVTINGILRTMQRVLSCYLPERRPPFSLRGLEMPEKDKLAMAIARRNRVKFTAEQTVAIANQIHKLPLGDHRKQTYAAMVLTVGATGLRPEELVALRGNDVDFEASTVRIDETVDQKTYQLELCKNANAYRTVLLLDELGQTAMRALRQLIRRDAPSDQFVFHGRSGAPVRATNFCADGLYPALKALGLPKAAFKAFRNAYDERLALAGVNGMVRLQMMGHSSDRMTELYVGQIPTDKVRRSLTETFGIVTSCDQKQGFEGVA